MSAPALPKTNDATVDEGPRMIPGAWLGVLAEKMKMTGFEWRVLVYVVAEGPVSAYQVAKRLGLRYQHVKRAAKELRGWNILQKGEGGLTFQRDPTRWERSEVPAGRPSITYPPNRIYSECRPSISADEEEISVQ